MFITNRLNLDLFSAYHFITLDKGPVANSKTHLLCWYLL